MKAVCILSFIKAIVILVADSPLLLLTRNMKALSR